MASAIIHLCVAKKVNAYLEMDEKLLSLGAIAPDLSKQIGETKEKSHFLNSDKESGIPDCEAFVKKYRQELDKPFEMGYLIHLITDKYWFRDYINKYIDRYTQTTDVEYTAMKSIIYNDYTKLNQRLIDDYFLDLYFFCNEIKYPKSKINEIPMDKLPTIIEKMGLIIQNVNTKKTVMMDEQEIINFIEVVSNQIIIDLKEYGLII